MAVRVSVLEVEEIIPMAADHRTIEHAFIADANTVVETNLLGLGLRAAVLKMIEKYLAAHFAAITEERGGMLKDKFGDGAVEFSDNYGEGFKGTRFGQMALSLDSTGTLRSILTSTIDSQFRLIRSSTSLRATT